MLCGNPEMLGDGSQMLKLQTNRPVVFVQDSLPSHDRDTIFAWLMEAYKRIGAVCDWKIKDRIGDLSEASASDIVHYITVSDLGGGGVLADQMLPFSGGRILRMRINSRITWRATDGPMNGFIDPLRTLVHETIHFCGLGHLPVGPPPEIMEPTVSQTIITPQPTEAKILSGWFGPPVTTPVPTPVPPIPPTGGKFNVILEIDPATRKVVQV